MDPNQIRTDFALYTDPNGLLQLHPHPSIMDSQNGILFTGHKMLIYSQLGILNADDQSEFESAMSTCQVPGQPGLYNRWQGNAAQEGPDDYIGIVGGSVACGSGIASQILAYGYSQVVKAGDLLKLLYPTPNAWQQALITLLGWVSLRYNWNNQNPGQPSLSAWLGRQPAIVAHMQWGAGQTPALWRRLVWFVGMVFFADWKDPSSTTPKILNWQFINVAKNKGWLEGWAAKIWYQNLAKNYPNGMKDIMTIYFGADHPCAKWVPAGVPSSGAPSLP